MKVNGIELLQMIKDGKVKADTEIKVWYDDGIREYMTTIYYNGLDLNWQPNTFLARYLYSRYVEFEIIEEEKEIEELPKTTVMHQEPSSLHIKTEYKQSKEEICDKINELVREVNKLKKEGK